MKRFTIQTDWGLLILRGAALLLLVVYGFDKFTWLFPLVTGRVAWSSWGFAAQIGKLGFPFPIFPAVFVVLCESVGALLIALGLFTRIAAALVTLSMAGALYFSLHAGEAAWQLALLYALIFVTLALTGPGRFSVDRLLESRVASSEGK